MERNKLLARFIASYVRNSELENLHAGTTPSSETGDFSDVKVITPYGEIPWEKLSRISDPEMRKLMLDIENRIETALKVIPEFEKQASSKEDFERILEKALFLTGGATWDDPLWTGRK